NDKGFLLFSDTIFRGQGSMFKIEGIEGIEGKNNKKRVGSSYP
ncbi:unnamed protein product, partial [marine sediment metagenome]